MTDVGMIFKEMSLLNRYSSLQYMAGSEARSLVVDDVDPLPLVAEKMRYFHMTACTISLKDPPRSNCRKKSTLTAIYKYERDHKTEECVVLE